MNAIVMLLDGSNDELGETGELGAFRIQVPTSASWYLDPADATRYSSGRDLSRVEEKESRYG